jgi:hypothetical protein
MPPLAVQPDRQVRQAPQGHPVRPAQVHPDQPGRQVQVRQARRRVHPARPVPDVRLVQPVHPVPDHPGHQVQVRQVRQVPDVRLVRQAHRVPDHRVQARPAHQDRQAQAQARVRRARPVHQAQVHPVQVHPAPQVPDRQARRVPVHQRRVHAKSEVASTARHWQVRCLPPEQKCRRLPQLPHLPRASRTYLLAPSTQEIGSVATTLICVVTPLRQGHVTSISNDLVSCCCGLAMFTPVAVPLIV